MKMFRNLVLYAFLIVVYLAIGYIIGYNTGYNEGRDDYIIYVNKVIDEAGEREAAK